MKDYKDSKVKDDMWECVMISFCFSIVIIMSALLYLLLGA